MFNPEMMKKYSEVGVKVQQLQEELQQTEIECSTGEGITAEAFEAILYGEQRAGGAQADLDSCRRASAAAGS